MNRPNGKCKFSLTTLLGGLSLLLGLSLTQTALITDVDAKGKRRKKQARRLDRQMQNNKYGLFGLRIHGNFAVIDSTRSSDPFVRDPSRGSSVGFGVTFDKGLNDIMSLRLDALYQNKNFSAEGRSNYNLAVNTMKETSTYMDFIEVPIMLVARFMRGQLIRPYIAGGVYGAMLLSVDGEQVDDGVLDEARRPFSTFDYGFVLAGGSYFVLSKGAGFLSAELRYSQGMANIADTDVETTETEAVAYGNPKPLSRQTYNINNLSLMIGYYF